MNFFSFSNSFFSFSNVVDSYVCHLENRIADLEIELQHRSEIDHDTRHALSSGSGELPQDQAHGEKKMRENNKISADLDTMVSTVGLVPLYATSNCSFLGSTSGLTFARLMFQAAEASSTTSQRHSTSVADNLSTKSKSPVPPAPMPSLDMAEQLLSTYFKVSNISTLTLHEPTFKNRVQSVFRGSPSGNDLFFLNIVFAIASAEGVDRSNQYSPESYHAAAVLHMDPVLNSLDRLEALQALVLMAHYSIMRPTNPGAWYIIGSAIRVCVDLGLHQESSRTAIIFDPLTLDMRRRLMWAAYALDRQICVYTGRPFGIADEVINVPFPDKTEDVWIMKTGIDDPKRQEGSSKCVTFSIFHLRQLQSEIQNVIYNSAPIPREFASFTAWRTNVLERLDSWYDSIPKHPRQVHSQYNLKFLELNYQQTRLLIFGLSPIVPTPDLEGCREIARSSIKIIKLYRALQREGSINYTWLAVHNLFVTGLFQKVTDFTHIANFCLRNILFILFMALSRVTTKYERRRNRGQHNILYICPHNDD